MQASAEVGHLAAHAMPSGACAAAARAARVGPFAASLARSAVATGDTGLDAVFDVGLRQPALKSRLGNPEPHHAVAQADGAAAGDDPIHLGHPFTGVGGRQG